MTQITDITFIYNLVNDSCYLQISQQPLHQLTTKGPIEREGTIIGTWFQVDQHTNHWISFRKDKYRLDKWEAFYKHVSNNEIKYYRRLFYQTKGMLTFSFSEKDEWIKDPVSGKWRSKF